MLTIHISHRDPFVSLFLPATSQNSQKDVHIWGQSVDSSHNLLDEARRNNLSFGAGSSDCSDMGYDFLISCSCDDALAFKTHDEKGIQIFIGNPAFGDRGPGIVRAKKGGEKSHRVGNSTLLAMIKSLLEGKIIARHLFSSNDFR